MISILGSLVSLGGTFLQGKQDEAKAKADVDTAAAATIAVFEEAALEETS